VAVALWFHDAIYAPRRNDNERQSAEWLLRIAGDAGVASERLPRLHALVMATCPDAVPSDRDARVLVDIDLAIPGSPAERIDAYEHQIRREYRWVPNVIFRRKRAAVLRSFLDRPRIYSTTEFDGFESAALANIHRSLTALGG
jgi:predicted metal-dependent HD superfamily phosphohydrolase